MYLPPHKKQQLIALTKQYLELLESTPTAQHCRSCEHFNDGFCNAFSANPPLDFYAKDCQFFIEEIDIPF